MFGKFILAAPMASALILAAASYQPAHAGPMQYAFDKGTSLLQLAQQREPEGGNGKGGQRGGDGAGRGGDGGGRSDNGAARGGSGGPSLGGSERKVRSGTDGPSSGGRQETGNSAGGDDERPGRARQNRDAQNGGGDKGSDRNVKRGDGGGDRGGVRRSDGPRRDGDKDAQRGRGGGDRYDRQRIRRYGRAQNWGGISFYFYDGYYYGDCAWLKRRAVVTGSRYWWQRFRQCRYWN